MMNTPPAADEQSPAPHHTRRRLIHAAIVILLVLALALTPPLLNVGRLRHRIATSMSQSLGRPVHLDNVSFHLLPVPGFTLQNLVVSEDPAFGNEPVIRANEVEATLRISSLWRHQIEISTIRFKVDENGSGPSLNIVRNAQGRWNLEEIFMQAAHANTAPTDQRKAGPAPRFPYIEATGARVNLKLGDEKMPFSLTDADFALWLPEPQQWHVRLLAHPARTDTNASDTGEVRLEGTLGHAASMAAVPVNLTLSWAHAQMGEATRLLTGDDQGWRGVVEAGATLIGPLATAQLATTLHITDLRRADFVPEKLLDVSSHCTAVADLTLVTLTQATCTIPTGAAQPIVLASPSVDLQQPRHAPATLAFNQMPLSWALDWARLFTQRMPTDTIATGTLDGQLTWKNPQPNPQPTATPAWQGQFQSTVLSTTSNGHSYHPAKPLVSEWTGSVTFYTAAQQPTIHFQFSTPQPGARQPLLFGGDFVSDHLAALLFEGTATPSQIASVGNALWSPLGNQAIEPLKTTPNEPAIPVSLKCAFPPPEGQPYCTAARTTGPEKPLKPHRAGAPKLRHS